jgi:hypothetical protein
MAEWESAAQNDGWETAEGWESSKAGEEATRPIAPSISGPIKRAGRAVTDAYEQLKADPLGTYWDALKGGFEGAAHAGSALVAPIVAGGVAGIDALNKITSGRGKDLRESGDVFDRVAEGLTYQPTTETGQALAKGFGSLMNDVLIPAGAVAHTIPTAKLPPELQGMKRKGSRGVETPAALNDKLAALERIDKESAKTVSPDGWESPKDNTWMEKNLRYGEEQAAREQKFADNQLQGELDLRAKDLPVDENGMPVDMQKSLDVQEAGSPEQMTLFGDEAPRNLTPIQPEVAPNELPSVKEGITIPSSQRGALDIKAIGDGFEAVKDGKRVGYLRSNLTPEQSRTLGEHANIDIVKVDSDVKGQGVGSALYKAWNDAHEGNVAPSGKTTQDAWNVWKRNYPEKVDQFVEQEAGRIRGGADPRMVVGNVTDPAIAQRILTESQRGGLAVPRAQLGAVDLGSPEPTGKVKQLTKDSPEVKQAKEEIEKQQRQARVSAILNDPRLDSYTTRIDSPEKVIASAANAPDISTVQALKARSVSPGMNSVAISSNNPLLRFTRDRIAEVVKETEQLTREWVTGKDGLGEKLKALGQEEKNEVVAALQHADKKQQDLSVDSLQKAGFNERQIAVIEHIQKMDALKLDIWNKARTEVGLPTVTRRAGHFAGNFSGDYRTLVLDKNKSVVGYIGTKTLLGNKHIQAEVLKKFPDASFAPTKRSSLGGSGTKATMFEGLQDLVSVLAKDDPRFAEIQAVVDAAIKDRGDSLYGAALHDNAKKGIWGNDGNKFWKDKAENTNEALKSFVDYWESGIASHKNLTAEVELKGLLDNPALEHMPNAKRYVEDYIRNFTGRSLGTTADALNAVLDLPSKLLGLGPSITREAMVQFNKRASQFTMGFINPLFLVTQGLQIHQMALPELVKLQTSLGISPVKYAKAGTDAALIPMKLAMEQLTGKKANVDQWSREAYQYAKENGLAEFSEYNKSKDIFQNKYTKAFDKVADYGREKAEQWTRPYVFFMTTELLRDSGMKPKEAFDMAFNMTQHAMINYHQAEKPMMYSRLGVLGNAAGSLQTFKHAYLGQLGTFIKEATNGKPGPLIAASIAMLTFAGLKGIPGYQEVDELVKSMTDYFYKDRKSISDIALKNAPEWLKSGALSASTGVNMQSRLSAADVLPNSPLEAVSPFASWGGKIASAAGEVISENDPLAWANLAKAAAPSGTIKGLVETAVNSKEPVTPEMYKDGTDRVTLNKRGEVDYDRSSFEAGVRKWTGGTALEESLTKEKLYNDLANQKSRLVGQKKITGKAERALAQGQLTEPLMKELVSEYQKEKGDPQQLVTALIEYKKTVEMTTKQRLQGIPTNTLSSIYRYQNYNDR